MRGCTCIGDHRWSDVLGRDQWVLLVLDPECPVNGHAWTAIGAA